MYYELYVDVLFLVNFIMDYILLLFVWKVLHCETRHLNLLMGAGVGALLTCILIILPIPSVFLENILFHLIVNTCMIRVGLRIKNFSVFMRAFVLLYIGTVLMGGIMGALDQYAKIGSMLWFFAIVGYHLSLGVWNFLSKLHSWNSIHVKVKISVKGQEKELNALIDTGNSLYDPITGKPISIISKQVGKDFLHEDEKLRYVSVHTVANADGELPIICAEKLWILDEQKRCFHQVLFAIAEEEFSKNREFQVILNPNLF